MIQSQVVSANQHPQYAGGRDFIIFSNTPAQRINYWELKSQAELPWSLYISGGKIQQLAEGMHLEVLPTPYSTEVIATVKIIKLNRGGSRLCVINKQGECTEKGKAVEILKQKIGNGIDVFFARLAKEAMIPTLRVYISDQAKKDGEKLIKAKLDELKIEKPSSSRFIRWVEEHDNPELIIKFPSELAESYQNGDKKEHVYIYIPKNTKKYFKTAIPLGETAKNEKAEILLSPLIDNFDSINKIIRIKELTKEKNHTKLEQKIEIELFKKKNNEKLWQTIDSDERNIVLPIGYHFGFTIKNNLLYKSIDLGLFIVDPNYKTYKFVCYNNSAASETFLDKEKSIRLAPDNKCILNHIGGNDSKNHFIEIAKSQGRENILGRYNLLIIATEKETNTSDLIEDYSYFLQSGINFARGMDKRSTRKSNNVARYLHYFAQQGGNRNPKMAQLQLPDHTKIFLRLIELDIVE